MFVPLEPSIANDVAGDAIFVRCDLACGNDTLRMHSAQWVCSASRDPQSVVTSTAEYSHQHPSAIVTATGMAITQFDAVLRRDGDGVTGDQTQLPSASNVIGVSQVAIERTDSETQGISGPHRRRQQKKLGGAIEMPSDAVRDGRWESQMQGPISHTAEPQDATAVGSELSLRSPADKMTTFRNYAPTNDSTIKVPAVTWSQGLVESSRRQGWLWPKIVDELIGRQWITVERLGRTALGNSRDETRRVMVTSTKRGDGRTTVALTLARWAAMTGQRTLLVDADIMRPNVASALHIAPPGDWRSTSLAFGVENSLITCRSLPLSLLPLSPESQTTNISTTLEQLIVQLAVAEQEFDCCVIDAGPIEELCQQMAAVTRLSSSIVVVNTHAEGMSPTLIGACNLLWQRGKPGIAVADNFRT